MADFLDPAVLATVANLILLALAAFGGYTVLRNGRAILTQFRQAIDATDDAVQDGEITPEEMAALLAEWNDVVQEVLPYLPKGAIATKVQEMLRATREALPKRT